MVVLFQGKREGCRTEVRHEKVEHTTGQEFRIRSKLLLEVARILSCSLREERRSKDL